MPPFLKKQADWVPEDIKYALGKKSHSASSLSVDHGYSSSAVSQALQKPWPVVEKIIAEALDLHPMDIWPSRYNKDGSPKSSRRSWKHYTSKHKASHVQSEQAA